MPRPRRCLRLPLLTAALLLAGGPALVRAQSGNGHSAPAPVTGKVIGTVYDRENRAPLVGGQVMVEGTNLGNVTNEDGSYFINGVPVGVQRIRSEYLGYQELSQELRVLAGQTISVDFAMASEVVTADAIVAVVEREPIPIKPVARGYTTVSVVPTHVPEPMPLAECAPTVTVHGSYILDGQWQLQVSVGRLLCGDQLLECRPVVVHNPKLATTGVDAPE